MDISSVACLVNFFENGGGTAKRQMAMFAGIGGVPVWRVVVWGALLLGALVSPAYAWGPKAHELVAAIAENELTPRAKAEIAELLDHEPDAAARSLMGIANWADAVRPSRRETGPWHYVNVPLSADTYDAQRDCPAGNCVVAKVEEFARRLGDRTLLRPVRAEALKYLIHFVGDIHQPLHCADNEDRGGNEVKVILRGRTKKLHQVWDSGIIDAAVGDHDDYATRLVNRITPPAREEWLRRSTPVQWVNECFEIAKRKVYQPLGLVGLPGAHPEPILLGTAYPDEMLPVVETQLMRAGTRLAFVLNSVLG